MRIRDALFDNFVDFEIVLFWYPRRIFEASKNLLPLKLGGFKDFVENPAFTLVSAIFRIQNHFETFSHIFKLFQAF